MTTLKRKKNSRIRGSTTHGWGSMKKNRGAGNRGGVGNAGSGKRGDANKPSHWGDKNYFGMHGFKYKGVKVKIVAINISDLSKYSSKVGKTELNLGDLGFNKLLGNGKATQAYTITVDYASANAIKKIEDAKGSVNILKKPSKANTEKVEKVEKVKKTVELKDTEEVQN